MQTREGTADLPQVRAEHTEVSLLHCSGLGRGSERGEALLPANASAYMALPVCFNNVWCYPSAVFNENPLISLTKSHCNIL